MPWAVSDTAPLISLLKISQLDLLQRIYGEILIPKALFEGCKLDGLSLRFGRSYAYE
jgi:predicted nucleic acid-binding protein